MPAAQKPLSKEPEESSSLDEEEHIEEEVIACFKCDGTKVNKKGKECKKCQGTGQFSFKGAEKIV